MKRTISILLVTAILAMTVTSCGDNTPSDETTVGNVTTDAPVSMWNDGLPSDLNFGGAAFNILSRTGNRIESFADTENGDVLNDAVYHRNMKIEDRLNVKLDSYSVDGEWAEREQYMNTLTNSVLSGSGEYDLAVGYEAYMAQGIFDDLYYNVKDVKYIDTSREYYFADAIKELTYNDKLYFMVSDFCLSMWKCLYVTFFNKELAAEYKLPDVYQLTREGKFTIDKLAEMTKDIYKDLNGDGVSGEEDFFGLISDYQNVADAYASQFDNPITRVDDKGMIYFAENNEKTVSIIEKMNRLLNETESTYAVEVTSKMVNNNPLKKIFSDGRAIFYSEMLDCAVEWRGVTDDFGILPLPKWDEKQERYQSQCWNGFSVVTIPRDAKNTDMSGAVFEALSAASREDVLDVYFDTVLTAKSVRDEESSEMIEISRDGIKFNFGSMNGLSISPCGGFYRKLLTAHRTDFASEWASGINKATEGLQKVIDKYME